MYSLPLQAHSHRLSPLPPVMQAAALPPGHYSHPLSSPDIPPPPPQGLGFSDLAAHPSAHSFVNKVPNISLCCHLKTFSKWCLKTNLCTKKSKEIFRVGSTSKAILEKVSANTGNVSFMGYFMESLPPKYFFQLLLHKHVKFCNALETAGLFLKVCFTLSSSSLSCGHPQCPVSSGTWGSRASHAWWSNRQCREPWGRLRSYWFWGFWAFQITSPQARADFCFGGGGGAQQSPLLSCSQSCYLICRVIYDLCSIQHEQHDW